MGKGKKYLRDRVMDYQKIYRGILLKTKRIVHSFYRILWNLKKKIYHIFYRKAVLQKRKNMTDAYLRKNAMLILAHCLVHHPLIPMIFSIDREHHRNNNR